MTVANADYRCTDMNGYPQVIHDLRIGGVVFRLAARHSPDRLVRRLTERKADIVAKANKGGRVTPKGGGKRVMIRCPKRDRD